MHRTLEKHSFPNLIIDAVGAKIAFSPTCIYVS